MPKSRIIRSPEEALSAYKALLRDLVNQRPSGTRQRIAQTLGTHKSFISQITNPQLKVPLPAGHVEPIMRVCHFTAEERQRFLALYRQAHPTQAVSFADLETEEQHVIRIVVPPYEDPQMGRDVEQTIREFAARLIDLSRDRK